MRRMPHYFRNFHCTGTACRDNCCCVGWEIEIDPDTAQAYRSMGGALGDRLRAALYEEDGCTCMGQVDGKCPFLDPQNLCSIQQTLGADMLGEICREHPRYYAWFHGLTEAGVGMCCEEAARLILSDPAPDTFLTEESREDNDCDYDPAVPCLPPGRLLFICCRTGACLWRNGLPCSWCLQTACRRIWI